MFCEEALKDDDEFNIKLFIEDAKNGKIDSRMYITLYDSGDYSDTGFWRAECLDYSGEEREEQEDKLVREYEARYGSPEYLTKYIPELIKALGVNVDFS